MPRAKRKPPAPDELIAAVREVPGVADAFVDDDASPPGQLRIELKPGYGDAEVAAAVDAVLRQRFNLGVDEDELEVVEDAEMRPAGAAPDAPADDTGPRPSIDRMHVVHTGDQVTAAVTIGFAGRSAVGEATGPDDDRSVLTAVAAASLRAADELAEGRATFELDHAEVIVVGGLPTAFVRVVVSRGDERRLLTGAAIVRDDARQAVIRATLHAVNRRLALLLAGPEPG